MSAIDDVFAARLSEIDAVLWEVYDKAVGINNELNRSDTIHKSEMFAKDLQLALARMRVLERAITRDGLEAYRRGQIKQAPPDPKPSRAISLESE